MTLDAVVPQCGGVDEGGADEGFLGAGGAVLGERLEGVCDALDSAQLLVGRLRARDREGAACHRPLHPHHVVGTVRGGQAVASAPGASTRDFR